jgi:ATP-dependent Clp protease adapter protein ClpS
MRRAGDYMLIKAQRQRALLEAIPLHVFRQSQRDAAARAMMSIRREGPGVAGLFTAAEWHQSVLEITERAQARLPKIANT